MEKTTANNYMINPDQNAISWLVGFTDGEGCFAIQKPKNKKTLRCKFVIATRDDDAKAIQGIQQLLRIGKSYRSSASKVVKNAKPTIAFTVCKKEECLIVCKIFSDYQLQTKKKFDFEIWKQAVQCWIDKDFKKMEELKMQLEKCRKYKTIDV